MKTCVERLKMAAKEYRKNGWHLVPIWGVEAGGCRCPRGNGCPSPGKHPLGDLVQNGAKQASASEAVVQRWIDQHPEMNIAVAVNPSGLFVIDVDPRNGGNQRFDELVRRLGPLPETVTARTGGGGWHYLFRAVPGRVKGDLGSGVDVKASGYILVAPSRHVSGRVYEWEGECLPARVAELPQAWVAEVSRPSKGIAPRAALRPCQRAVEGARNTTLASRAGSMARAGFGGRAIEHALLAENAERCDPPLDEEEVRRVAESISRYRTEEVNNTEGELRTTCASDIAREEVSWIWPGRIPAGKLTLLDGDPGLGKSTLTLDIAARVSSGRAMPGETSPGVAGDVLVIQLEDDLGDTVRPRLEAAGAMLDRVHVIDGPELVRIPRDLPGLKTLIQEKRARLVVVDPLVALLQGDMNSDQEVRAALAPLAQMLGETGCALVGVRHLNKRAGASALYRGGGSIGLIGSARCALLAARDPRDQDCCVLAQNKNNLARKSEALRFRITEQDGVALIEWLGSASYSSDELVAAEGSSGPRPRDRAKAFLVHELASGPREAAELKALAEAEGISASGALERAKRDLGISSRREGDHWEWLLPASSQADEQGKQLTGQAVL